MKKGILTLIICLISVITIAQIPYSSIPFEGSRSGSISYMPHAFTCNNWPIENNNVWTNFQLSISDAMPSIEDGGWYYYDYYRSFQTGNNNYTLSLILIGAMDYNKDMLVTKTPNNDYIDAIEVGIQLSTKQKNVIVKQYKIAGDGTITVYLLRPTRNTSIMVYDDVYFPINAQRIDTVYEIDSTGHFDQISQTLYAPQNYTEYQFSNENYNIWDGTESILP